MKNGCVLDAGSSAVIASSVIVLCLYNSLPTNRGSVGRLEPPYLSLPSTHHPCFPPLEVCQVPNSYQNKPVGGQVVECSPTTNKSSRSSSVSIPPPAPLWLCRKLSVRWPAPSVFRRAGPEDNGTEWSHAEYMRWDRMLVWQRGRDRVGKLGFLLSREIWRQIKIDIHRGLRGLWLIDEIKCSSEHKYLLTANFIMEIVSQKGLLIQCIRSNLY